MKRKRIFLALAVLALASLACQALTGGGNSEPPGVATRDSGSNDGGGGKTSDSGFPLTDDAYDITEVSNDTVLYYTMLSLEEVMKFYRDEYNSRGYTERELLTVVSDGVFSIVFDGDPTGKAVVIQSVDLGDGSRTVTISLQEV